MSFIGAALLDSRLLWRRGGYAVAGRRGLQSEKVTHYFERLVRVIPSTPGVSGVGTRRGASTGRPADRADTCSVCGPDAANSPFGLLSDWSASEHGSGAGADLSAVTRRAALQAAAAETSRQPENWKWDRERTQGVVKAAVCVELWGMELVVACSNNMASAGRLR